MFEELGLWTSNKRYIKKEVYGGRIFHGRESKVFTEWSREVTVMGSYPVTGENRSRGFDWDVIYTSNFMMDTKTKDWNI